MRKSLFGAILCLVAAAGLAAAQQGSESKLQPPLLRPTGDILVKALLAADGAKKKKESLSAEELKRTIDQEVVKAAAPVYLSAQDSANQKIKLGDKIPAASPESQMIMVDGAIYFRFGGTIYPVSGGGASGCFTPEIEVRVQKARMKFAERLKAERVKAGQEKEK